MSDGTLRGDGFEAVRRTSGRESAIAPTMAAARSATSVEEASAGARRATGSEATVTRNWRPDLAEATNSAPAVAAPGTSRTGFAPPAGLATVFRLDAAPPLLPLAPTHIAAGSGPARVLHIQLQPAELGTLEVRMRMTDVGLEIHVEASRRETFALLQRDRDVLSGILRGAGHPIETVTVSVADKSSAQPQQPAQESGQPVQDGRPEAQSGGARQRGDRPEDRFPTLPGDGRDKEQVQNDQDPPVVAARSHGSLYL